MLLLVNIPLGLFLTKLHWQDYLASPGLRGNFVHNLLLVKSAWTSLPGVLSDAPWPHAVNGSLWTLTYEVRLYIWLGACFAIARIFRKRQDSAFAVLIWATWIVALSGFAIADHGRGGNPIPRLVLMFASGMLMHQYRERLRISWAISASALVILVIAWIHGPSFRMSYGLIAPYLFVALAYLPKGAIRIYNRAGDYSFGLYIYAFPIQQTLVLFRPEDSPLQNAAHSALITFVFAWLSWNLVEKRLQYRPPQVTS
jgi:peptidoglycan/LPS O-acetylase OafA/YrhL